MKFIQDNSNGSCDLIFDKEEIEIINKHKKICFTAESLNQFGNILMKIVVDWNINFNEDLQKKLNDADTDLNINTNDKSRK